MLYIPHCILVTDVVIEKLILKTLPECEYQFSRCQIFSH
ncbi:hypothetical protein A6A12_0948 [Vibrio anguillarum]|nr:hypothetical protein A6A12_0948 [Vibrio anguillarum]